jgi:hypothetical protein
MRRADIDREIAITRAAQQYAAARADRAHPDSAEAHWARIDLIATQDALRQLRAMREHAHA